MNRKCRRCDSDGTFFSSCPRRSLGATACRRISMLPLKNPSNIPDLVHRRLPCLYAAKLLRLTHTQGRDELLSGNLQPLRGSISLASLAFSVSQPHFAGSVKAKRKRQQVQ